MDDLAWVLGWVSAVGYYAVQGDLRDTGSYAVAACLDNNCRDNPLQNLSAAAKQLIKTLAPSN